MLSEVSLGSIAKVVAAPIIRIIFGPSNKKNVENALKSVSSRAHNSIKFNHKKFSEEIYNNDLVWDILEKDLEAIKNPTYTRDYDKLFASLEPVSSLEDDEIKSGITAWYQLIDNEIANQPDLYPYDAVQKLTGVAAKINEINAELGIADIRQLDNKVRKASSDYIGKIVRASKCDGSIVELAMFYETGGHEVISVDIESLIDSLRIKKKLLIKAEPGAGKSTTLMQLAKQLLSLDENLYPQFIDLSYWTGENNVFEYLANNGTYSNAGLTKKNLQTLSKFGHLVFIFDGWNEVSIEKRLDIEKAIKKLLLEYPNIGALIATRPTSIPPVQEIIDEHIRIKRLDIVKRNEIIEHRLDGSQSAILLDIIGTRDFLRELTAIPLYLNVVITVFGLEGEVPDTKEQLLAVYNNRFNEKTELLDKLYSCHHEYMVQLSVSMMRKGTTNLVETEARRSVHDVTSELQEKGQLSASIQPRNILEILTQYHQLFYNDFDKSWQFQHQQFQEWFASFYVEDVICKSCGEDGEVLRELREQILNFPVWEEAVFFACERLVLKDTDGLNAVAFTVKESMTIDPLLSAEVIYRCSDDLWEAIAEEIVPAVIDWHKVGTVDRAIKFMIATGREEFSDYVWPLITNEDNQTSSLTFRAVRKFRISVLGPNIREELKKFKPETSEAIIKDFVYEGDLKGIELATEIAMEESNVGFQAQIIHALQFRLASNQVNKLVHEVSDEVIQILARDGYLVGITDSEALNRIKIQIDKYTSPAKEPREALQLIVRKEIRDNEDKRKISTLISAIDFSQKDDTDSYLIRTAFELYPTEVTKALIKKLENGEEIPFRSEEFFKEVEINIVDGPIVEQFLAYEENNNLGQIVAPLVDTQAIEALIVQLREVFELTKSGKKYDKKLSEKYHSLKLRIRNTKESSFLDAIINLAETDDLITIYLLSELLSSHGSIDQQSEFDKNLRLIQCIQKWGGIVLSSPDADRSDLAAISKVIIRMPSPKLLSLLEKLLCEDIERKAVELEEFLEALKRGQNIQNGARVCYSWNYRDAFAAIGNEQSINVLKSYLGNFEFGEAAAEALRMIWQKRNPKRAVSTSGFLRPKFEGVREKIEDRLNGIKIKTDGSFAEPIISQVKDCLSGEATKEELSHAIKLACVAFSMPFESNDEVINQLLRLPYIESKLRLMTVLANSGYLLRVEDIKSGLNEFFEEAKEKPWLIQRDKEWRANEWLELFPFSDNPFLLFEVMDGLEERFVSPNNLEKVLTALREVPEDIAEELLFEFVNRNTSFLNEYSWMNALIHTGTLNCARFLLQLLEKGEFEDRKSTYTLSSNLRHFVFKNKEFMEDLLHSYKKTTLPIASEILAEAISEEPTLDTIKILFEKSISNNRSFRQTRLYGAIKNLIIGREESDTYRGSFELFGQSASELRIWLFSKVKHQNKQVSELAYEALIAVDDIRDEYGHDLSDPRHPDIASGLPWPIMKPTKELS